MDTTGNGPGCPIKPYSSRALTGLASWVPSGGKEESIVERRTVLRFNMIDGGTTNALTR